MQSGPLYAKFELVNNLDRRFKVIQRRARKLLAKRRGLEPLEVEWRVGSIHDLRRTYGTWLRDAGRPLDEIQRLLGHADITTTIRFYIGRNRQSDELVRAALDGAGSRPKSDLNAGQDRSTADETTVRLSKIA